MAKNPVLIGLNDADTIYGTGPQQTFAREMAKSLLGEQAPTDARHWSQGLAYVLRQLAGAQYRDIAGQQDRKNVNKSLGVPTPETTYGTPVARTQPGPLPNVPGISLTPERANLGGPQESTPAQEAAKSFEGFNPNSYQDGKNRMSIGYGTEGKPGETIDKAEGTRRFNEKWAQAEKLVTNFHPNMDEGLKEALTDLTYNAGTKWMTSGLGAAVKAGDMTKVRELFNEYNKADMGKGLEAQPGLVKRRDQFSDLIPDGRMNAGLGEPNTRTYPGAPGELPNIPVKPTMNRDQLDAALSGLPPEKRGEFMQKYLESVAPYDMGKTPTGNLIGDPLTGNKYYMPGQGPNISAGGINTQLIPVIIDGKTYYRPAAPGEINGMSGQGTGIGPNTTGQNTPVDSSKPRTGFEGLNPMFDYGREQEGKGQQQKAEIERYQKVQDSVDTAAINAKPSMDTINLMKAAVKDPAFYSGMGNERVLDIKKVLDVLGIPVVGNSQPMEVFKSVMHEALTNDLKTLQGLGQIRTPEIEILQNAAANLSNRPAAINALLTMREKLHQRAIDVFNLSRSYAKDHDGRLDRGWERELVDYQIKNPLFSQKELNDIKHLGKEQEPPKHPDQPKTIINPKRIYVPGKGWEAEQ